MIRFLIKLTIYNGESMSCLSKVVGTFAVWRAPVDYVKSQELGITQAKVNYSALGVRTSLVALATFTLLPSLGQFCLLPTLFYARYDLIRANQLRDDSLQAKMYMDSEPVPRDTMLYLMNNPNAMKLILKANGDLNKTSEGGLTLLDHLVNKMISLPRTAITYTQVAEEKRIVEMFELMLARGSKLTPDQFFALAKGHEKFAERALSKMNVEDFSTEQLLNCWKKHRSLATELAANGFLNERIDSEDSPLITRLLGGEDRLSIPELVILIKAGARLPEMDKEYPVADILGDVTQQKLKDFLENKPDMKKIIDQSLARRLYRCLARPQQSSPLTNMDVGIFDFKKPVLQTSRDGSSFEINSLSLNVRVLVVAYTVFVASVMLSVACLSFAPLALLAIPLAFYKYEWSRATKALNTLAVIEFDTIFPSNAVSRYILKNVAVLDKLDANYKKINNQGHTLWELVCKNDYFEFNGKPLEPSQQLNAFKKLTDKILAESPSPEEKVSYLKHVLNSSSPICLEYFLSKCKPQEFTPAQQHDCWVELRNAAFAPILKKYGFDVNSRSEVGLTPLFSVIKNNGASLFSYKAGFELEKHVQALIASGADKLQILSVDVRRRGQKEPDLRHLNALAFAEHQIASGVALRQMQAIIPLLR